jgi:CarD family transcriptional regulator
MSAKSTKSTSKRKTTFAVDQQIVYPLQGVGQIQEIVEMSFKGDDVLYYVIYIPVSDMTVKVPVDRAEQLGIRAIVSRKESEQAMDMFSEDFEPIPADWKMRYQMNLDLLKQGSIHDIASVVRTLYQRKKVKELPIMERKLYDSALQLLVDEVSFSLEITTAEVEEMVFQKLERGSGSGGKQLDDVLPDDDEDSDDDLETTSGTDAEKEDNGSEDYDDD